METVQVGFARCLNAGCDQFDTDREIEMVRTRKEIRAEDLPVIVTASDRFHPADDKDIHCPSCGEPCALLHEPRRVIPRMI